jgi:hypothetical protein
VNVLKTIGSIAAMFFTAGSTLAMWVFAAASLANNTSEASLQRVKLWVLNFSLCSAAGIAIGIWLLCQKSYGWSTGISLLPAIAMGGTFIYLITR